MLSQACVSPAQMRAARDLLRGQQLQLVGALSRSVSLVMLAQPYLLAIKGYQARVLQRPAPQVHKLLRSQPRRKCQYPTRKGASSEAMSLSRNTAITTPAGSR